MELRGKRERACCQLFPSAPPCLFPTIVNYPARQASWSSRSAQGHSCPSPPVLSSTGIVAGMPRFVLKHHGPGDTACFLVCFKLVSYFWVLPQPRPVGNSAATWREQPRLVSPPKKSINLHALFLFLMQRTPKTFDENPWPWITLGPGSVLVGIPFKHIVVVEPAWSSNEFHGRKAHIEP